MHCETFSSESLVEVIENTDVLEPSVVQEVDQIWALAQKSGAALHDGKIFSLCHLGENFLQGCIVPYRYLFAQQQNPKLYDLLQVRPVAVSGIFYTQEGVVLGKRSAHVVQHPGCWELVPSGGLDMADYSPGDQVDYIGQLLIELQEEVGVFSEEITRTQPFCVIYDDVNHVYDIGIQLKSDLGFADVVERHQQLVRKEYDQLSVIDVESLNRGEYPLGIIPESKLLLSFIE